MNMNLNDGSAKIYQFPVGGARNAHVVRSQASRVIDLRAAKAPVIAVGGAWYHDAAIQDAQPVGKR